MNHFILEMAMEFGLTNPPRRIDVTMQQRSLVGAGTTQGNEKCSGLLREIFPAASSLGSPRSMKQCRPSPLVPCFLQHDPWVCTRTTLLCTPPCTLTQLSSTLVFSSPRPFPAQPPHSSAHLPCPLPSPGRHSSPCWAGPMQLPTQRGLQGSGYSSQRLSQGHSRCWRAERGLILPVSPRAGTSHGMRGQRPVSPSVCCSSLTQTLIAHSWQPLWASACPQGLLPSGLGLCSLCSHAGNLLPPSAAPCHPLQHPLLGSKPLPHKGSHPWVPVSV